MFYKDAGPYTGEISPKMLKEYCEYVILGHSERRTVFEENDELINKKTKAAIENNIIPIICVGENISERESGLTKNKIRNQLLNSLLVKYLVGKRFGNSICRRSSQKLWDPRGKPWSQVPAYM